MFRFGKICCPSSSKIPAIKIIDLYRLIRSSYQGKPILIESFSARDSASVRNLPMVAGDGAEALREMGEGKGVIISESFQSKFGKGANDTVELMTPSGLIGFKVIGVYVDYSSDSGSVLLDRALYKKYWQDDLVDAFDLWLEPGADQAAIAETIKARYGEPYQLFISTHRRAQRCGGAHHGAIFCRQLCRGDRCHRGGNFQRDQYAAGIDSRSHAGDRRACARSARRKRRCGGWS